MKKNIKIRSRIPPIKGIDVFYPQKAKETKYSIVRKRTSIYIEIRDKGDWLLNKTS